MSDLIGSVPLIDKTARWLQRTGASVFMFHRILPEGETCYDPEMVTSVKLFANFLDWVCDRYQVLPLEELVAQARRRAMRSKPLCAITFDDGWRDVFTYAFPLLQQHRVSATVFLPTRFAGTDRRFWQERLWFCLEALNKHGELNNCLNLAAAFPWFPPLTIQDLAFVRLRRLLLSRPSCEAEDFVRRLEEKTDSKAVPPDRVFLNWSEVLSMRNAGIDFGSHTLNHTLLTRADRHTARVEIESSKRELEDHLNAPVIGFSYPWGRTGRQTRSLVEEAGYSLAVTTRGGLLHGPFDRWLLPRVPISSRTLCGEDGHYREGRANLRIASMAVRGLIQDRVSSNRWQRRERLRIAFIIDSIHGWEGGTEQQLGKLLAALDRKYFEPALYLLRPSMSLTADDFPCSVHLMGSRANGGRSRLRVLLSLFRLLRAQRPHVVQTFFADGGFYGSLAAWMARIPVTVNSRRNTGYWQKWHHRFALKVVNQLVDLWQCNSRAVWEVLKRIERVPEDRIEILPNAIDLVRFSPATSEERTYERRRLGLARKTPVFVSVANLRPIKDLETLIEAAGHVRRALPSAVFLLVGEGPLRNSLATLIDQRGLAGTVQLVGRQQDVRPYLAASDIGLLTSRSEGCANSLLEYMAMGLPAVVSDIPANRELVNSVFFDTGSGTDLAAKILYAWNNPNLRRRMRHEYRQQAMQYSAEAFVNRVQSYYEHLGAEYL